MLRERSPTDEVFWIGGSNSAEDRHEIYSSTRYILCHMISEFFVKLGAKLNLTLSELLYSEEGKILMT